MQGDVGISQFTLVQYLRMGGNYMRKDESKTILSNEWKKLIIEDAKTKEKLVIINSDGVEITSSHLSVRLVPKE